MTLKAKVEYWKEGLSPDNTAKAWATAATITVILAVLIEEEVAMKGGISLEKLFGAGGDADG